MRQRLAILTATVGALALCGASRARREPPTTAPNRPAVTVASLVPSATDLLLGAGLGGHLVGVSDYCGANPAAKGLPRVGDYQNTHWETLAGLHPNVMLVFMDRERLPAGMEKRAQALGIRLEVVKVETVADVGTQLVHLGELLGERGKAEAARDSLLARLTAVRERVTGLGKVRTLLVLGEDAKGVIGPGGFLDELLTMAGGTNAASGLDTRYPSVDTEQMVSLAPRKIIHLMPGATEAQVAAARERWARMAAQAGDGFKAARDVTILTDWYLLLPGWHLGDIAESFAAALHGEAVTKPSSRPVP